MEEKEEEGWGGASECAVRRERKGEGEAEIGQGGAAERKGKSGQGGRVGEEVKGWKNVGILQQSGWCEGGRVRNVAGNARASSVCKKTHTATFLILDITDKLSKHARCAFKVQGCYIQIFSTAKKDHALLFFRSFCEEGSCRGILNLSYVVTLNWKGVCFEIPTANTIKHVCLQRELSPTLCVSWKRNTARSEGVRNDGYEEREAEEEDRRLLWNVCGSGQNSTISFVRA